MAVKPRTHYDVLGVKAGAKQTDIGRAYNKWKAQQADETAAPDPRSAKMIEAAYKVLANPGSREEYDRQLAEPQRKKESRGVAAAIAGVVVLSAVAGAAWLFMGSQPPKAAAGPPGKPVDEIKHLASLAVGRLDRIDMSGTKAQAAIAFAIDENVMVTACNAIVPTSQHVVHLSPRDLPARVMTSDESLGLCQLAVEGAGSKPLTISAEEPRAGDKIYATKINAVGEVSLIEGSVKKVSNEEAGRVIEASVPVAPASGGAPLLDVYARVVGVAAVEKDGRGRHIPIPKGWNPDARPAPVRAPPPVAVPSDEPKQGQPKPAPELRNPTQITPDRKERLEKAFRPPPSVPDDL